MPIDLKQNDDIAKIRISELEFRIELLEKAVVRLDDELELVRTYLAAGSEGSEK